MANPTTQFGPKFGLGLRKPHNAQFLEGDVPVDFVEVISENFMVPGGRPRDILRRVRAKHPVALHGVSMSLGSADGVDQQYLLRLRALADEIEPLFISDHLCWSRIGAFNSHDLLPVPYNEEALAVTSAAISLAQELLGRTLLIENPSSYVQFARAEMTEWEFLAELCRRTGCDLLLDVNNIHVSAVNHGFDPRDYIDGIPFGRVRQIHLAGHSKGEKLLIDTHDQPVADQVWLLFAAVMERVGAVAVMIERDDNIPPLDDLLAELDTARAIVREGITAWA
ncbi:MAG: DUF692 domain-containing protein [Novosphingobium sp.]